MSAPFIWIFFPGIAAGALFFLRRWYRVSVLVGTLLCLILAGLALTLPVGGTVVLGAWVVRISDTVTILGRRMVLTTADQPMLVLIYLMAAFWFGASHLSRAGRHFVPLGLGMVVALTAALAVEPFLYAALLIELAALLAVPILAAPGLPVERGVLRYLTFQTLGMPLIIFTGWLLEGAEASAGNPQMMLRAAGLLLFGFMILLAVIPFHTWVPMLAGQARPYAVAFVLVFLPWMVILFGIGLLDQDTWLRTYPGVSVLLQRLGLIVCVTAGAWMAFERDMGRILGYAVLVETGFSILALGLSEGVTLTIAMILPRTLALGIWSLGLTVLKDRYVDLKYSTVQGAARYFPVTCAALVLGQFSIAGFPLLAGFPVRLALWEGAAIQSNWIALGLLFASVGIFTSGLRTLAVLVMGKEEVSWKITETWKLNLFLGIGIVALITVGVAPQLILPAVVEVIQSFPRLIP